MTESNRPVPADRLVLASLCEAVAAETGLSRQQARTAVVATFDVIARTVAAGHSVAITNFGSWTPYRAEPRVRRDPRNGEPVPCPAHQALRWRLSPRLRDIVRDAAPDAATIRKLPKTRKAAL